MIEKEEEIVKKIIIKIICLEHFDESLPLPSLETAGAAGVDIRASLSKEKRQTGIEIPGEKFLVPTGLCMAIPFGYEIQIRPRSGLSYRTALALPNSPGTIDSDYRGELKILMGNYGKDIEIIRHGDRVAQMIVSQVLTPDFVLTTTLDDTARGDQGFGSTGLA